MIDFYSTDCPKCKILKMKLTEKNIAVNEVREMPVVLEKAKEFNVLEAPFLVINNSTVLTFAEALNWIKEERLSNQKHSN